MHSSPSKRRILLNVEVCLDSSMTSFVFILNLLVDIERAMAERNILSANANPFLVSLKFSFQTPDRVYFVLDFIQGGELFVHLQV